MFTGLVETKGTVERIVHAGGGGTSDTRLVIRGELGPEALALGESIAVDGVCLTVASIGKPGPGLCVFEADASAETLAKTTIGELKTGAHVNLERAMPLGGRMGGHIVSGHVDGVGTIAEKTPVGAAVKVAFQLPKELVRYVAPKGSICVSGVSLTVNNVNGDRFDVFLVPHTREKTSLDALPVGARVNIEVDLLARYVARLLETSSSSGSSDAAWTERLQRAGYL
ncbi:MAG: riboflavin synthase [Myxococcales bacterium]|jgi:riboflavin synthase|nr:riboflavin synthase [Myxococcales bacterium]